MDLGILSAAGVPITNPLPASWLGRIDAPPIPPAWANFGTLSSVQLKNLQAQLAYDLSAWDYTLIGNNNELGRYQIQPQTLENYGLLAPGSVGSYGTDAVNYRHCWQPTVVNNGQNVYENYFYNIINLRGFLSTSPAQEHLAYQMILDLYTSCTNVGAVQSTDTAETVAGMISVAWTLGTGTGPTPDNTAGTGAWAWRYNNLGDGANSYNSGRYAIAVLSR